MAGLNTVLDNIGLIRQGVSLATGAASTFASRKQEQGEQDLALRQLQEQQRVNQEKLQQDAALERERITAQAEADENDRKRALRRAVSRQRAQFGAQGRSAQSGSAEAILLGLFDESAEDLAERERMDTIRNRALDQDIGQQRSLNVLQRTQLKQRQNLDNQLSRFGFFSF